MLELDLGKPAAKFLARLSPKQKEQIWRKLFELLEQPYPNDIKRMRGYPYVRVDVGEYRIVYRVYGPLLVVRIIGKRNDDEVYKRLKRLES